MNLMCMLVPYLTLLTLFTSGGTYMYLYNSPATGRGNNGLNVPTLRELCRKLFRDGLVPNVGKVGRYASCLHSIPFPFPFPFQKSTLGTQSLNQVFS